MVRYDRPVPEKIMASWRYPSEIGWLRDLYRYPDNAQANEQWLEQRVFQRIDSMASPVLGLMLQANPRNLSPTELSHWSLLVRSLMHRTPENLRSTKAALARIDDRLNDEIRENYVEIRGPGDPETYAEYATALHADDQERAALRLLPGVMTNPRIGTFMINMKWRIFTQGSDCPSLLMSDDPVARTNGIGNPGGHLAMPLSPEKLLVMAESDDAMVSIQALKPKALFAAMNTWTVESARRFVVAADRQQERFIRNRFGKHPKPSLTNNLSLVDEITRDRDLIRREQRLQRLGRAGN